MLRKAQSTDVNYILDYLKKDIPNCIYLYIDVLIYGLSNPNIEVWYDGELDDINIVIMKYHDSFQVYSNSDSWNLNNVCNLILEHDPLMISGRDTIINKLKQRLGDHYDSTYGVVLELKKYRITNQTNIVQKAEEKDIREIAQLMCEDDYYRNQYTADELEGQFLERMRTNMGRNYIIREDNKIVAHDAIFAETEDILVASGFIVRREYRNKYYETIMEDFMINELGKEGRTLYSFVTDERRIKLYQLMGNCIVAMYGKLVKKD